MKKESIFVYTVVAALFCCLFLREAVSYVKQQNIRFVEATRIVKRESLKKMYEAEAENNITKLAYYRHLYNNADKVVVDYGVDFILKNKKAH